MVGASAQAETGPVISVRDVVVSYDGRRVLDGINLSCAKSSVWSIRNPERFW